MPVNIKYLKEKGLYEDYKRYKMINEYTYFGANDLTNEADEEDNSQDTVMPKNGQNNNTEASANGESLQSEPSNGDIEGNNEKLTPDISSLDTDEASFSDSKDDSEVEPMQDGDEVIDVDDLTKAQKDTDDKVNAMTGKFDKMMAAINAFEALIKSNDEKIEDLKAEIERRNPTQIEKLNMQTAHSYPFSVKPEEYWKEKESDSNYRASGDSNDSNKEEYVITKSDIDSDSDWKKIADSLNDDFDENEYHQTLGSIFGL